MRHGAECFNWFFPQEIDDELLVISDTLPGNVKWKKVNPRELQDILITKIEEGFTFPINPKCELQLCVSVKTHQPASKLNFLIHPCCFVAAGVLCDPGWRRVYDKLLASKKANVQDSINCWLPKGSGLREEIDRISKRHPRGFECGDYEKTEGTEVMDKMQDDLERYVKIQRAWRKLRIIVFWMKIANDARQEREAIEMAARG